MTGDQPARTAMRILLVEDDPDERMLVSRLFAAAGVEPVLEAADGDAAIGLATEHAFDLIVLDIGLPGRSGLELLPVLRELAPDAAVVMLSNFPHQRLASHARARGATGYVEKRTAPGDLVREILTAAAFAHVLIDTVSLELPNRTDSVREARRFLREALATVDAQLLGHLELLVSELVANALLHTSSAPRLSLQLTPALVRVEVDDADPTLPQRREPDGVRPGGRGLHLVEQLASRWGADPHDNGKVVWFEMERSQPAILP